MTLITGNFKFCPPRFFEELLDRSWKVRDYNLLRSRIRFHVHV